MVEETSETEEQRYIKKGEMFLEEKEYDKAILEFTNTIKLCFERKYVPK